MTGGQSASFGKLMQPGDVLGALTSTFASASTAPMSATTVCVAASKRSNCTVTRLGFRHDHGASVRAAEAHTVLPRCTEKPEAAPPPCPPPAIACAPFSPEEAVSNLTNL